jgi:hypothetical protein
MSLCRKVQRETRTQAAIEGRLIISRRGDDGHLMPCLPTRDRLVGLSRASSLLIMARTLSAGDAEAW